MPIYDYQCKRCGQRFEELVKPDETPPCPKCGAARVERFFPTSAAVSTGRTRERALTGARRKASAEKRDKDHAHSEYLAREMKDHG